MFLLLAATLFIFYGGALNFKIDMLRSSNRANTALIVLEYMSGPVLVGVYLYEYE